MKSITHTIFATGIILSLASFSLIGCDDDSDLRTNGGTSNGGASDGGASDGGASDGGAEGN